MEHLIVASFGGLRQVVIPCSRVTSWEAGSAGGSQVTGEWHYLHGGELSDMPGRCETWQASVCYLGDRTASEDLQTDRGHGSWPSLGSIQQLLVQAARAAILK